jgi:alpha-glutamyl/putrescinyl thymine pyrophosphorylase clade 1
MKFPLLNEIVAFATKREHIRVLKEKGFPKPWTQDPLLQQYSFTNVHREDDKQTRLIAKGWRRPYGLNPDLWFLMFVARLVNWWPTLEEIGPQLPWKPSEFTKRMNARAARGDKVFSGAYIINQMIKGGTGMPKGEYLAKFVLDPLWKARETCRPRKDDTLEAVCERWTQFKGVGGFIAAQVIADVKYAKPLLSASDWSTWAASGPGSRRGLNLALGRERDTSWEEGAWLAALQDLRRQFNAKVDDEGLQVHAQDMQNVLCEWGGKYKRGYSRTRYNGLP